jgi:hypothetical protein
VIDANNLGMRVRRRLAAADIEPTSVPPSSILLVRRLPDPARGVLLREPDVHAPSDRWVRAARADLDDLYRRAARPAYGATPSSAASVLFRDLAEMLACLARDFLLGSISGCWWWQAWFRATNAATLDDVLRAWCREARHAPAAFAMLDQGGYAERFLRALSPRQARAVFVAMAEAYDLPALAAPTSAVAASSATLRRHPGAHAYGPPTHAVQDSDVRRPAAELPPPPPWEALVPWSSVPAALGLEHRTLLGTALALFHAPLAVRALAFQRAFHAWRRVEQLKPPVAPAKAPRRASPPAVKGALPEPVEQAPDSMPDMGEHTSRARSSAVDSPAPEPGFSSVENSVGPSNGARGAEHAAGQAVPRGTADAPAPPSSQPPRPDVPARRATPSDARPAAPPGTEAAPGGLPPESASVLPAEPETALSDARPAVLPSPEPESIVTALGGVLFLINAFQRLELFDRLDDHFGVASRFGAWGWLEIVARTLLGHRRAGAATDPLWLALAALDGREPGEAISVKVRGPGVYRLPEGWSIPGTPRHAAGPLRPLGLEPGAELRRLLRRLVPYLRWRLLRALAIEARSTQEQNALLAARLLYRRARMTWTSAHVDLHMSMDQVDISVRLAGLDANPGWVPALGRVVTFYFEQE